MLRPIPLLVAALPVALTAPAPAQSIVDHLPAETAMVLSAPDIQGSMDRFDAMPLARMWAEPEVQDFTADALELFQVQWARLKERLAEKHESGESPVHPKDLEGLRLDRAAFAVTSLGLEWDEEGGKPLPRIGVVLQLDFGQSLPKWRKLIEVGLEELEKELGDEFERSESAVGGSTLASYTCPEIPAMGLHIAEFRTSYIVGTLKEEVVATLEAMEAGTPVLAADAEYRRVFENVDVENPEMEVFFRTGPFLDLIVDALALARQQNPSFPVDPDGVDRALDALGLRAIKGMGAASAYVDGECVTRSYVSAPAPERRGLLAGGVKELDLGFLHWVPKNAVSVTATTFDATSLYSSFVAALKAYDDKMAERVLATLEAQEERHEVDLQEDVFGAFGNQMVIWSMPMAGMFAPPEAAFLIEVDDQEGLMKALESLDRMSDLIDLEAVERRGISAHKVDLNFPQGDAVRMGNPFVMGMTEAMSLTFTFKDGYMVAGLSAGDVKRACDRMDREDDPKGDIRSHEEFAAVIENLPEQGLVSLTYTDWKAQFEGAYQTLTPLLALVPPSEDIPIDMALLPETSTLTQHLNGGVTFTVADGQGFTSTSRQPIGPEILGFLAAGVFAGGAVLFYARGMR